MPTTNERRVVVGPSSVVCGGRHSSEEAGGAGPASSSAWLDNLLSLPCPRTGSRLQCALASDGQTLCEVQRFKERFTSWLVGETVVQDGTMYCLSPLDAASVLYPALKEARARSGGFESAEQLLEGTVADFPDLGRLAKAPCATRALQALCECKNIGGDAFFRLSDERALAWAVCKAEDAEAALRDGVKALAGLTPRGLRNYAVGYVSELMPKELHDRLRAHLDVPDEAPERPARAGDPFADLAPQRAPRQDDFDDVGSAKRAEEARKQRERAAAKAKREEAQAEKRRRESAGMKSIASFFAKKPKKG